VSESVLLLADWPLNPKNRLLRKKGEAERERKKEGKKERKKKIQLERYRKDCIRKCTSTRL
jgi:hypothetical protein